MNFEKLANGQILKVEIDGKTTIKTHHCPAVRDIVEEDEIKHQEFDIEKGAYLTKSVEAVEVSAK